MVQGTVKWFSVEHGHGFIGVDDGKDVFVREAESGLVGVPTIEEGQRVEFEIELTSRGPLAMNVRPL